MANYLVNGVPLFAPGQEQAAGRGWLATRDRQAAVGSLREIAGCAEQVFGTALPSGMRDLLPVLADQPGALTLPQLAQRAGVDVDAARGVVAALLQRGLLRESGGDGAAPGFEPAPRLAAAVEQFTELVDRAVVSRAALRRALLLGAAPDAATAALLQRVFDAFFDLGWLYLHNWAGTCTMMAQLVCRALQWHGAAARVQLGTLVVDRDGRSFGLGREGGAGPGQFDGHAYCVVDERLVVDFGLGNLRRAFRRDLPWALTAPLQPAGAVLATLAHPRIGRATWFTDWQPASGLAELDKAAPLADELMQVYRLHVAPAGPAPHS